MVTNLFHVPNRAFVFFWVVLLGCLGGMGGALFLFVTRSPRLAILTFIVTTVFVSLSSRIFDRFLKLPTSNSSRPVVRVWTRNRITAVCAEEDYQLWRQVHERGVRAGIEPERLRPAPKYTAFFTDDPGIKDAYLEWWTGPMGFCDVLIGGCQIDRSELFIPNGNFVDEDDFTPVLPEQAWRLIYGSEPPEGIFAERYS